MGTSYEKHLDLLHDVGEQLREFIVPGITEPVTDVADILPTLSGCVDAVDECIQFFADWYEEDHTRPAEDVSIIQDIEAAADFLARIDDLDDFDELAALHSRVLHYIAQKLRWEAGR